MTNHPPHAVLSLDEAEYLYMVKLIEAASKGSSSSMREISGMSSDDPRAKFRAMLIMAAGVDIEMTDRLTDKLSQARDAI